MDSSSSGNDMNRQISLSEWSRQDLNWWLTTLPIVVGGTIPMLDLSPNPNAIKIYTDAAGGSTYAKGNRNWIMYFLRDLGKIIP